MNRSRPFTPVSGSAHVATDPSLPDVLARGFHTVVRGHAFAAHHTGQRDLCVGAQLRLVREFDNPADALAIAVWTRGPDGWRVGYLDRSVSARLAPWLDTGRDVEATVRGWTSEPGGRWRRPVIAVSAAADVPITHAAESSGTYRRDERPEVSSRLWGRPPGAQRRVIA
ncbi:MAG: HIRAN domain-containing protein [Nitriliruptoraceae bacterium]